MSCRLKPILHFQLFPPLTLAFTFSSLPQSEFEKFGPITDVHNTGKGYAFVTFEDKDSADTAIREMDGATLNGQQIKVNEAKPREGGRGGGAYLHPDDPDVSLKVTLF